MHQKKVLVINAGSSTLKCSLFSIASTSELKLADTNPNWQCKLDWDLSGSKIDAEFQAKESTTKIKRVISSHSHNDVIENVIQSLWSGNQPIISAPSEIATVGHRIVHGGTTYSASTLVTPTLLSDLQKLAALAPDHQPSNIAGIEAIKNALNQVPQIAVFDTAFHASMPKSSTIYPCPYEWYEKLGIRRFGFHGISHQYCASRAAEVLERNLSTLKIISCHLGGGASLCAIKNGKSLATSMGFTPLEGLVMGTRSGSIDPGILLHLLNNNIYSLKDLTHALHNESGLKGISGLTADMREIERLIDAGNDRAKLAFEIYVDHLASQIASMLPKLGGLDALIFTGGVGQNSSAVRLATSKLLSVIGIDLDSEKNRACNQDADISTPNAPIRTLVLESREDLAIANECLRVLRSHQH